jgi:two-component system sensor histidine kinase BaeS
MTRRLVLLIVATVAATLLLVGGGTLAFATLRARATTTDELQTLATSVNDALLRAGGTDANRPAVAAAFRRALRLDGIEILVITRAGRVVGTTPPGVPSDALDPTALAAGQSQSGHEGSLVWVAAPVPSGPRTIVTVLTRRAETGLGVVTPWFLLASLLTLVLGVMAALLVGRRLSRPVREADRAARRIADGELHTRLPNPPAGAKDELSDLARAINSMAESLERSRGLEQQFLLSVSHDLRTPLTSIRGYAEAITDGAAPDVKAAALIILREARRLERLVSDLLDLGRLEARAFTFTVVPVDLGRLAVDATHAFEPDAARRSLTVTASVPGAPVVVRADPDRLSQAIGNLLDNASRFARTTIQVAVDTASPGIAQLSVDDDGPGIADEDLPHVFERLYVSTHHPTRSESGSGLGLAIVRQLVEAMGGRVSAGRAPSGGARLTLHLPVGELPVGDPPVGDPPVGGPAGR